jgi:hypothetical protein
MTFIVGGGPLTGAPSVGVDITALSPVTPGGTNAPSAQFLIWNLQSGTVNYSISCTAAWLSTSVSTGSATTEADLITVNYATTALSASTYSSAILITDGTSTRTIQVTLRVLPSPSLVLSTNTVTLSCPINQSSTSALTLKNGDGSGSTLVYSISSDRTWLTCNYTSGTCSLETDTLVPTVSATGLAIGTYTGHLTVTATGATNSPQIITVNLTVTEPVISRSITMNIVSGHVWTVQTPVTAVVNPPVNGKQNIQVQNNQTTTMQVIPATPPPVSVPLSDN